MKNRFLSKLSVAVCIASLLTTMACLDDNFIDFTKVEAIVELPDAVQGASGVVQAPLAASAEPVNILVRVNVTGPSAPKKAVTVSLGLDQDAFDAYVADNPDLGAELLPSNAYSFPSPNVVIAAGERVGVFNVAVNTNLVDLTKYLILPLKITDAGGKTVSGNFGTILFHVTVKNIYDGLYTSTGTRYNYNAESEYTGWPPTGYASAPSWSFDYPVSTVNAATSATHCGNNPGGFGEMNITVNGDNTVLIESTPDTGLNALVPLPGKTSTYDPATKTFDLYYQYTNTNGTFRVLHQVMVFKE